MKSNRKKIFSHHQNTNNRHENGPIPVEDYDPALDRYQNNNPSEKFKDSQFDNVFAKNEEKDRISNQSSKKVFEILNKKQYSIHQQD